MEKPDLFSSIASSITVLSCPASLCCHVLWASLQQLSLPSEMTSLIHTALKLENLTANFTNSSYLLQGEAKICISDSDCSEMKYAYTWLFLRCASLSPKRVTSSIVAGSDRQRAIF